MFGIGSAATDSTVRFTVTSAVKLLSKIKEESSSKQTKTAVSYVPYLFVEAGYFADRQVCSDREHGCSY